MTILPGPGSRLGGYSQNNTSPASPAVTTLVNDTIYGNSVVSASGSGGGIADNSGTVILSNLTNSGNNASSAGGMEVSSGAYVLVQNSIVAGNNAGTEQNLGGTLAAAYNNVFGDTLGYTVTSGTNNIINSSPGLAATLANNGGPTMTLALLGGSSAIGQGGALTTYTSGGTSTSIVVADGAAIASTSGEELIEIDGEQMLVIDANLLTNTLTVIRGYNGTTIATPAANANIYLEVDQARLRTRPPSPASHPRQVSLAADPR